MAGERTLNWAPEGETPKYRTQDTDPNGGDFIVAETPGDGTVLLQWNDTAGQWEYGGPVDLGGSDLSSVGALDATSVTTEDLDITIPGASDSTEQLVEYITDTGEDWQDTARKTTDVSTSAKAITGTVTNNGHQFVLVMGKEEGFGNYFYEVVHHARGVATDVMSTLSFGSSVEGRTYTDNNGALELAMAGSTYNVVTRSFQAGGFAPV